MDLIQRSLADESVVITLDARPAVALKPVRHLRSPITAGDLDRTMANLVPCSWSVDAATLVERAGATLMTFDDKMAIAAKAPGVPIAAA